ncbi:BamA/TamA family outer membrane protein [Plebeiibacterium marinum]|uniref:BamA/TamA family outer membrane protein n=1 Tax=Plebeiibacterium marinum TaxID=2992111 RepID=A0AAE3MGK9_9BACT|nr:BamA/TamA family outer membrane protein [Plebeiobacterium marinum]MCW3807267.1 BamA/TamA family outer membrane protein [Plebeiobacterium marinum]
MLEFRGGALVFFLFFVFNMLGQEVTTIDPVKTEVEGLNSLSPELCKEKNLMITPYVAPTYTPELGMLISGGGLVSFKIHPQNPLVDRSSVPFSIGYSTNGSISLAAFPCIYGKNDKIRILTRIFYRDMPDNYWGVGYDAGNRTAETDATTNYQRQWFSVEGKVVRRVNKNFFVGLSYDFNSTKAMGLNEYMQADAYVMTYGSSATNFGLGLAFELDKRDNVQNPQEGYLLSLAFTKYNKIFRFSDSNEFSKTTLDARKYFKLGHKKVLATQFKTQFGDGNIPWMDMPQLGTPFDLRGYHWGRFRDKISLFGITEYRHMFSGRNMRALEKYISKMGFVVWSGFGAVTPRYDKLKNILPNVGAGLRVEIQPGMNLRVDYGVAKDQRSLYIAFSEAF